MSPSKRAVNRARVIRHGLAGFKVPESEQEYEDLAHKSLVALLRERKANLEKMKKIDQELNVIHLRWQHEQMEDYEE